MSQHTDFLAKPLDEIERRIYYDANMFIRKCVGEIVNNNSSKGVASITGHLALGEAFGTARRKGQEELESLLGVIEHLGSYLRVVSHDGINDHLALVLEIFPRLAMSDAIHLATALSNDCEILRSSDGDLYGLDKHKLERLCSECGSNKLLISS